MTTTPCDVPGCAASAAVDVRDLGSGSLLTCRNHWHDLVLVAQLAETVTRAQTSMVSTNGPLAIDLEDFDPGPMNPHISLLAGVAAGSLPVCLTHWDDLDWVKCLG